MEDVESYCDEYESGFGIVSTLFSDDSTILEEVSIEYDENEVATYDDYCDETVGDRSRNLKIFYATPRSIYGVI